MYVLNFPYNCLTVECWYERSVRVVISDVSVYFVLVVDGAYASPAADGTELAAKRRAHSRLSAWLWHADQVVETTAV